MASSFVTIRHRQLSRWQSTVHEFTMRAPGLSSTLRAQMREAVDRHVTARSMGLPIPRPAKGPGASPTIDDHVFLSAAHFERAEQTRLGGAAPAAEDSGYWSYSNYDPNWFQCVLLYNEYYVIEGNTAVYYDWTTVGRGNINFGVIDYELPNDATVLIIGDWGTGMNDAVTLLQTAIATHNPTAILHLGDIYYSGTLTECQNNVTTTLKQIFNNLKIPRIPVFMIPGNHEYYSGGQGFYTTIAGLNPGLNGCQQQASYFCLRTQDQTWQFLAMDTGVNDHDANMDALGTVGLSPFATGPGLVPTEVSWHANKLQTFAGNTILLSHHQVFSANAAINGWATSYPAYLNSGLFETFLPYFGKISAWIWGHEHNFAYFQDGLFGLNKGRLLGNSAYEELTSSDPYDVNYPAVPYAPDMTEVSQTPYSSGAGTYYNHSYAVVQFARSNPSDPITISYYQFPSWGTSTPPSNLPPPALMYSEQLSVPDFTPTPVWSGNKQVTTQGGGAPLSNYGPSLAFFDDTLYMAYKGAHSNTLYLAWYDGANWYGNTPISDMPGGISPESNYSPSLAVFNGLLYMIYKGAHSNTLYVAWYNGSQWAGNVTIDSMPGGLSPRSNLAPAALGFNGQLVIVYKGESSTTLYSAAYNGTKWSGNTPISTSNGTPRSQATPSLAIYDPEGGAPQLYMAYIGQYTTAIYVSWFDGSAWHGNNQVTIPGANPPLSSNTPWIAQAGEVLVMLYTGEYLTTIYSSSFDGSTWSGNQPLGNTSPISPASSAAGSMVPYATGTYTVYIGAYTTTIYQAQLQILGSAATARPAGAAKAAMGPAG